MLPAAFASPTHQWPQNTLLAYSKKHSQHRRPRAAAVETAWKEAQHHSSQLQLKNTSGALSCVSFQHGKGWCCFHKPEGPQDVFPSHMIHRFREWFQLEGTFKDHRAPTPLALAGTPPTISRCSVPWDFEKVSQCIWAEGVLTRNWSKLADHSNQFPVTDFSWKPSLPYLFF